MNDRPAKPISTNESNAKARQRFDARPAIRKAIGLGFGRC